MLTSAQTLLERAAGATSPRKASRALKAATRKLRLEKRQAGKRSVAPDIRAAVLSTVVPLIADVQAILPPKSAH
jgi:hypothetical protein